MLIDTIQEWLNNHPLMADIIPILLVLVFSLVIYLIMKKYVRRGFTSLVKLTDTKLDDILIEAGLTRLLYLVPIIIIHSSAPLFGRLNDNLEEIVYRITIALISFVIIMTLEALLNAVVNIYERRESIERIPIKSHIQLFKIFVYVVGTNILK